MKSKLCLVLALMLSGTVCLGGAVEWGIFTIYNYESGVSELYGEIYDGGLGGGVGLGFETQRYSGGATMVHRPEYTTLGYSLFLLPMDVGSLVDYESVFVNGSDFFQNMKNGVPSVPFSILQGKTAYLAIAFGVLGDSEQDSWLRYGWIEFGYNGANVFIVNSAVETTGLGIFAGTGNVVPEPSSVLLALSGFSLLLLRRRKPVL